MLERRDSNSSGQPKRRAAQLGLVPLAVHQRAACCHWGREVVLLLAPSVRAPRSRNRLYAMFQLPVLAVDRGLCRRIAAELLCRPNPALSVAKTREQTRVGLDSTPMEAQEEQ